MKKIALLIVLLASFLMSSAQVLTPVKWEFSKESETKKGATLVFKASIDEGWHLYDTKIPDGGPIPTTFTFEGLQDVELVGEITASVDPKIVFDESFQMDLGYFSNEVQFKQKVKYTGKNPAITGYVDYMSCNDQTCTPPTDMEFSFGTVSEEPATVAESTKSADNQTENESYWGFFFLAFAFGLAALLTPCVFPMIPMTVSFFMHSAKSKLKARFNAIVYGVSIVLIYTVVGSVFALIFGPDFANFLSTHWIPNIIFFLFFMIFAASFFGMFEIVLPSKLVNKSDANADKGGAVGAFFMALTLVLVSFSCTGPLVGSILVESAGGQFTKPIVGMLGFSLAFAIPFTLFAWFPNTLKSMPKSGGWLNSVKVVLGFIELALGLKFLSVADQTYHWGLLDREVYIAFWIVIFTLMGMYLLGKLKFAHDSDMKHVPVPRLLLAILSFTFVVYLVPGMWGAPLKALSGYLPPMATHDFNINKIVRDEVKLIQGSGGLVAEESDYDHESVKYGDFLHLPHGLEGYFDYEQGVEAAKKANKPIFIDFTGHGCVNCREMEARVWSDPRVLKILKEEFIIIALYVDDKKKLPESEWVVSEYDGKTKKTIGKINADFQISRFQTNAQPYYCLLDLDEELLVSPKAYDLNVENFIEFLNKGIAEFKK